MSLAAATEVEVHSPPRARGEKVHLVWYTDPYNVWCWGCEPAIRRVETVYADAVQVDLVMGGLFEDFGPLREQWARMSGGRWEDSVLAFLNAVAEHHRMPMDTKRMMDSMDDLRSTWPSCIAVEAAVLQGPSAGARYLRGLREALYLDGRAIHHREVQIQVASELGLGVVAFERSLDDGSADGLFRKDLDRCRTHAVTGFPTFELHQGEATVRMEGWQPWDAFEEAIQNLDPSLQPRSLDATPEQVRSLLRRYGRCATLEIAAILGVTDDEAEILLEDLEAKGAVLRREVGTGLFWELRSFAGPLARVADRLGSPPGGSSGT